MAKDLKASRKTRGTVHSRVKALNPPITCRRKKRYASSGYRGVCWLKRRQTWRARIEVDGKREHLGYFKNEVEAALAFDKRAKSAFGDKCIMLNFPESKGKLDKIRMTKEKLRRSMAEKQPYIIMNESEIDSNVNTGCSSPAKIEPCNESNNVATLAADSLSTSTLTSLNPFQNHLEMMETQTGAFLSPVSKEWIGYIVMNGKPFPLGGFITKSLADAAANEFAAAHALYTNTHYLQLATPLTLQAQGNPNTHLHPLTASFLQKFNNQTWLLNQNRSQYMTLHT